MVMTADRMLVLVLGVHRSGTSVLTSALAAMGCATGEFAQKATDENPDGYYEHPAFRAFNDRLLKHLGGSWDNWGFHAGLVAETLPALGDWLEEATALLQGTFAGPGPFVLKDPRLCTLLPFWRVAVARAGLRPACVIMLRDPQEVADSQTRRAPGSPVFYALLTEPEPMAALWAVTMQGLLASLPPEGAYVVPHAGLIADPAATLAALAAHLGLNPEGAATRIKPALHRNRAAAAETHGWFGEAQALFAALRGHANRVLPAAEAARLIRPGLTERIVGLSATRASLRSARLALDAETSPVEPLRATLRVLETALRRQKTPALLREIDQALAALAGEVIPDPLLLRAGLAQRLGQADQAEALLRQALALHPGHLRGWRLLVAHLQKEGRGEEAAALLAEARERFPNAPGLTVEPPAGIFGPK
jgi:hypothetical protein